MSTSKNPSQNKMYEQQSPKKQNTANKTMTPWTFGYPQCINKKQSRLVCLHAQCEKFPFFCSSCEDQSCQIQHQHKDRISSIGFKQLIKRLITQRKPPAQLQRAITQYKNKLVQLQKNVNTFVQSQTKSMDQILKKATQYQQDEQKVVAKLRQKKYQQIKGKQLDHVWKKVAPNQMKQKLQKQMIEFIDSKKEEVGEMTKHFQDGIQGCGNNTGSKNQQIKKPSVNNSRSPSSLKK